VLQVGEVGANNGTAQKAVRMAVEGLPKLQHAAVSAAMCRVLINKRRESQPI
jgi:hypothetical protein